MRSRRGLILIAAVAVLAACGDDDPDPAPAACSDTREILAATQQQAELRISDCFVPEADAGELQRVGAALVSVATRLTDQARANPDGPAAGRLRLLLDEARRGEAGTGGIHHDLLRRLEQEASAAAR